MWTRWTCALALPLACFSPESSRSGDGSASVAATGTTTGGEECAAGAAGCACYGNGTCDAGLECEPSVLVCIPANCDPGSLGCTCADTACLADLSCEDGICVAPSSTTGATSDPDTTAGPTGGPSTDPTDPTDPMTQTDSNVTSLSTTGPDGCGPGCEECVVCAPSPEGACAEPYGACADTEGCIELYECCATDPDSCSICCGAGESPATAALDALIGCLAQACPGCPTPMGC